MISGKNQCGRPPVRTADRFLGQRQRAQQRPGSLPGHSVAKSNRAVAGDQRRGFAQATVGAALTGEVGQQQLQHAIGARFRHVARGCQQANRMRSKALRLEAERSQPLLLLPKGSELQGCEVEQARDQQQLRRWGAALQTIEKAIEQHPFVGRMLVDQDSGIGRLCDQIALQQLADVGERRQLRLGRGRRVHAIGGRHRPGCCCPRDGLCRNAR